MKRKIKYLWLFAKPYKWSFVNAFLCILFTSIISMLYPSVFKLLVDEVFYNKNMKFFLIIVIGYAILYFTEQILHLILNILWPYQFNTYLLEIRKTVYKKIILLKHEKLSNMPIGDLIGKINWQSDSFLELLHRNIAYLFADTIKLISVVGIAIFMNNMLAIVLIIVVPISYFISYKLGRRVGDKQADFRDSYLGFLSWIFEMLGGIRDIKLFSAEDIMSDECNNLIMNISAKNEKVVNAEVLTERLCALIAIITNISLYAIAGMLVYFKEISLGTFIALIAYYEMGNVLLGSINSYWSKIHGSSVIIDSLIDLLESSDEREKSLKDIGSIEGNVEFINVNFQYGDKKVLDNLSLKIEAGESVAIVGKSGSGKSTIANILLKMLDVEDGEVLIDSTNINCISADSIRNQVGIVQQEIFVFDGTVRDNLLISNSMASEEEMQSVLKSVGLEKYILNLEKGLDTVLGQEGIIMSGGERQRLAIARLFLKNVKILVFDEATSSLDTETETNVNKAWKMLSSGKTSIIIAHRLSTILNANKVAVLDNGTIVGYDRPDILIKKNEQYRNLFLEQYLSREKVPVNER